MRTFFRLLIIFAILGVVSVFFAGTGCDQRVDTDLRVAFAGDYGLMGVISTDARRNNPVTRLYTFSVKGKEKADMKARGEYRGQLIGLFPFGLGYRLVYSDGAVFDFSAGGEPEQVFPGSGIKLINAVSKGQNEIYALGVNEANVPNVYTFSGMSGGQWNKVGQAVAMLDTPAMLELALLDGRPAVFWRSFIRGVAEPGLRGAVLGADNQWQRLPIAPGAQFAGTFAVVEYKDGVIALQERSQFAAPAPAHSLMYYKPDAGWSFLLSPDVLRENEVSGAFTAFYAGNRLWLGQIVGAKPRIMYCDDPMLSDWRVIGGGGDEAESADYYFLLMFLAFMLFTSFFFRMIRLRKSAGGTITLSPQVFIASPIDRAVAMMVDAALVLPLPVLYLGSPDEALRQIYLGQQVVSYLIFLAGLTLYSFIAEALFGQTFGKWLFKIRVKSADGSAPSFGQILVRNACRFIDFFPVYLAGSMIWYLIALLAVTLTRKRQRVGDLLAGTVVRRIIPVRARQVVLASASPRRRELLAEMGITFSVLPADIDESPLPGVLPRQMAERLARGKAEASVENSPAGALIIAADTIVVIDDKILGKPTDRAHAAQMLRLLSGRTHQVITAVSVIDKSSGQLIDGSDVTEVYMREISDAEINAYVHSGEADDKAGAYAIQGKGGEFVTEVKGSLSNVIGLPVEMLTGIFKDLF